MALALALWAGLAVGAGAVAQWVWWCAPLGGLLLMLPWRAPRLVTLAFVLLGIARGGADAQLHAARLARLPPLPAFVRVVGIADEPPRRSGDAPVTDVRVLAASPRLPEGTRIRIRLPARTLAEWGDTLVALVRLDALPVQRVPGGYDARSAARTAHRAASGRAYTVAVRAGTEGAGALVRSAMRLRRAGEEALARGLPLAARELAVPLLFGDRDGMDPDTDSALRASGLVHLLALSGLHVTWFAAVARGLVALAGGGLTARALAGATSALAYALIAGPIPSLARAVASEAAAAGARLARRALDPLQSLALAALWLLAWQPAWAQDLGFQLSCAATFGLVTAGTVFALEPGVAPRGARVIVHALSATLGAQLAALPLLLVRFHALPWTSLAANLVAVPLSEALLAAAAMGALVETLCPGTGHLWWSATQVLAAALHAVTRAFGAWPGALLAVGDSPWPVAWALAAAGALGLAAAAPRALDARVQRGSISAVARRAGLACAALSLALAITAPESRPAAGEVWVVALDVGQGDAIAVAGRDGWWLVDTGPRSPRWDAGEGAVLPFLRWAGVRELHALVLTHDDGDHTGGAAAVRRGVVVRRTYAPGPRPGVPGPAARFAALTLVRGDSLRLDPGARVCWPPRVDEPGESVARRGDNAASLVLELGGGAARALLTADADSTVESALVVGPGVALLKAGHHGSGSSSGAGFVRALRPARVIVSCGLHNAYGHPNVGALARLAATGAVLDRTDGDGTLWYALGRDSVRRLDWRHGEPRRARRRPGAAPGLAGAARAR